MSYIPPNDPDKQQGFLDSDRQHILMITNHGIHQWQIIPGLPDTGGQNVFVNQFTTALVKTGFKVTIANRGGYPHPTTGELRRGVHYKDEHQRVLYLEDSRQEFIRKEEMAPQIPELVEFLDNFLTEEGSEIDLILSHYWDGAQVGVIYNEELSQRVKHIWLPHSLGAVKKRNVSPARYADLHIDERIEIEKSLIDELDGIAATSATIRQSLRDDYEYTGPDLFLPPGINPERYYPREIPAEDEIWDFLDDHTPLSVEEIRACKIVIEISRTDTTKRKSVLIKAFAEVRQTVPDSLLIVSIDDNKPDLARELKTLIHSEKVDDHTLVVGNVHNQLPKLYAITDVYCTPSIMEGFGMSVQEAAASRVPVVASHLVPFATEYLLGDEVKEIGGHNSHSPLQQGDGAIVVQADEVKGFAQALTRLLTDEPLRQQMAKKAYEITIPHFTWDHMVQNFLEEIEVNQP